MIKKNIKTIGEKTHNATFRLGLYWHYRVKELEEEDGGGRESMMRA